MRFKKLNFKKCECGRPIFGDNDECLRCRQEAFIDVVKIIGGAVGLIIIAIAWTI